MPLSLQKAVESIDDPESTFELQIPSNESSAELPENSIIYKTTSSSTNVIEPVSFTSIFKDINSITDSITETLISQSPPVPTSLPPQINQLIEFIYTPLATKIYPTLKPVLELLINKENQKKFLIRSIYASVFAIFALGALGLYAVFYNLLMSGIERELPFYLK